MHRYSLELLDDHRRPDSVIKITCVDDEEALLRASRTVHGGAIFVWRGHRLVGEINGAAVSELG